LWFRRQRTEFEGLLLSTNSEGTPERTQKTITQEHPKLVWQTTRREEARTNQTRKKEEEVTNKEWVATRGTQRIEGNSLVLHKVNCRSILNKVRSHGLERKLAMLKYLGTITQLLGETGTFEVVECSFV
jgi:hypothetical protein